MMLMHDGLVLGLTPQDFIFRVVTFLVVFFIAFLIEHFAVKLSRKALDSSKLPSASIFVNIIRGIIWVFAILAVLQPVFGIQPTAFVTALGVTSIALSFGLQDTISNLVGGLGLMLGGVVKPGDQVSIGNISGEVIDMNWRSTIVRDRGGKVDIIPNSVLNKTALVHRTRWDVTEVSVTIVLKPSADLDAVTQEIIETIQETVASQLDRTFPIEVEAASIAEAGITVIIHAHIKDDANDMSVRDKIVRALAGSSWLAGVGA